MIKLKSLQILIACMIIVSLACKVVARANDGAKPLDSARSFVQNFYGWYLPTAQATQLSPPWKVALMKRGDAFDANLAVALNDDIRAQDNVSGEIVGVDFDPFLFSQDPCERYEVGSASAKGASYFIDVHGVCSGVRNRTADVVAEVIKQDDQWKIVNFHYANDTNLVSILRLLRNTRSK